MKKVLSVDMGPITHGVFSEQQEEEEPVEDDISNASDAQKAATSKITDILTTNKHVFVK